MQSRSNAARFWPILFVVVLVDVITKAAAERQLLPRGIPHEVLGNGLRFTLVYNPGAAFGLNLGPQSRWIFAALTLVALVILARLYRTTRLGHTPRTVALALVCAGALGNLFDRVRSFFGVVDFIDVGVGDARWPTFNVADMAVSVGAALLAWVLWQEDREARSEEVMALGTSSVSTAMAGPVPSPASESVDVA
ncbi:MAG: signal peptidase II [Gemmatimonadetes bacterium]|jgi:signal peptidase II|nr:signal peptidase II [Gemmatimonadota bacterium]